MFLKVFAKDPNIYHTSSSRDSTTSIATWKRVSGDIATLVVTIPIYISFHLLKEPCKPGVLLKTVDIFGCRCIGVENDVQV